MGVFYRARHAKRIRFNSPTSDWLVGLFDFNCVALAVRPPMQIPEGDKAEDGDASHTANCSTNDSAYVDRTGRRIDTGREAQRRRSILLDVEDATSMMSNTVAHEHCKSNSQVHRADESRSDEVLSLRSVRESFNRAGTRPITLANDESVRTEEESLRADNKTKCEVGVTGNGERLRSRAKRR